jgi:hypothetical protein
MADRKVKTQSIRREDKQKKMTGGILLTRSNKNSLVLLEINFIHHVFTFFIFFLFHGEHKPVDYFLTITPIDRS